MSQRPDDLELIVLDLIEARLLKGEQLFVFSAGNLRGKLVSATYLECAPSPTFLASNVSVNDAKLEPCVQLVYIPRPRSHDRVKDPLTFKFTRKPVLFNVPVRIVTDCLFLQKIQDGVWMLNINTSVKK